MDDPVPLDIGDRNAGQARQQVSGHQKKRMANALPHVFFLYDAVSRMVPGAAFVVRCAGVAPEREVSWALTRGVEFCQPCPIGPDMMKYKGQVFALTPEAEARMRLMEVRQGGILGAHFGDDGHRSWRCMRVQAVVCQQLFRDASKTLWVPTAPSVARAAGVVPEKVEAIPRELDPEDEGADAEGVEAPALPQRREEAASSGAQARTTCDSAERRLMTLYKPSAGAVKERYTVEAILAFLDLSSHLRPMAFEGGAMGKGASLNEAWRRPRLNFSTPPLGLETLLEGPRKRIPNPVRIPPETITLVSFSM